ncbi:MAG: caspase family protein [Bacteroidales bacterium]
MFQKSILISLRRTSCAFIILILSITYSSGQITSPSIYISDFKYQNECIEVTYGFANCLPNDLYSILLEAYTQNGKLIKAKSVRGAVDSVFPGDNKKISWFINQDADFDEENIYLKIKAIKYQKSNKGKAYFYSTLFPGSGHKQVGGKNQLYLGLIGYSGIAGTFYFNGKAAGALDAYATEPDKTKSDELMNEAKKNRNLSYASLGVSLGIWALDYFWIHHDSKKPKVNKPIEIENIKDGKDVLASVSQIKFISTRGLPPNLFAELSFKDSNDNGLLEANEEAEIQIKVTNQGKGNAYNLKAFVTKFNDPEKKLIGSVQSIPKLAPGDTVILSMSIKSGADIKTEEMKFQINVSEKFGYDMDPAYLVLKSIGMKNPVFRFSGLEILDSGIGTAAIEEDGKLQSGEMVKAKLIIQNVGEGNAENAVFNVITTDKNIYLDENSGTIGNLKPGEVKEIYFSLSPNKRVNLKDSLSIFLNLKCSNSNANLTNFHLPLMIDQKPPQTNIVKIENLDDNSRRVASFEYSSKKFTAAKNNLINIKSVIPSKSKLKNSVAVIFGVSKYENMAPAPYADNDAAIMKEYFEKVLGIEQVLEFSNEEVTISKMNKIFSPDYGELQKAVIRNETEVFVYFSGHGIPDKTGENTYLFPYDGVKQDLETFGYNTDKLYENLCKLEAKSVTVIIDACFSGGSRKSSTIKEENLVAQKGVIIKKKKPWINNDSFTMVNSSTGEETSLAYDESETGLFTYYFCAGLQGKADENGDNKVTFGELKRYVTNKVIENSKKISGLQTPEFDGIEDRILVVY